MMDDDIAEAVLKAAGEVAVDKALGSRKEDSDSLPFMEGFPAGSKFIIKACVDGAWVCVLIGSFGWLGMRLTGSERRRRRRV